MYGANSREGLGDSSLFFLCACRYIPSRLDGQSVMNQEKNGGKSYTIFKIKWFGVWYVSL